MSRMTPQLFHTDLLIPPHRVTHEERVNQLTEAFHMAGGWSYGFPVLVGYEFDGRVQLLSGSHRYEAAQRAGILVPVIVYPYEVIKKVCGTLNWSNIMRAPDYEGLR